ncbi:MAG: beta-lactamase family protein [Clostridiales bacterium]|nr:beta-lactamase family protein [Clostridiales bacterium]
MSKEIPAAGFPEQAGISSLEIKALIDDFKDSGIEVHSMKILRHGKSAFEAYAHPYRADMPHVMYSVSKSFVSVAMGFMFSEGRLTPQTKVIDLFPDFKPANTDEKLEQMTVFHLLTMTAGKSVSIVSDKKRDTWVRDFFKARWGYTPGEGWEYISENTYICGVIIKRLTGLGLIDYLTPRLFEPLGITRRPVWESDPAGQEAGGWGLFITTDELARFMLCLQQKGVYDNNQVIPADYVAWATSALVMNNRSNKNNHAGYGAYFWRNAMPGTYRADGMFSQFGIVFEDYDACFVCTCSEIDEAKTLDCIFRHFPAMFVETSEEQPENSALDLKIEPLPVLEAMPRSVMEEFISGKRITFAKNPVLNVAGFPTSMLPIPVVYMSSDKGGNIENVVFDFKKDECTMAWDEGRRHNVITCGMDGKERYSKIHLGGLDYTAVSTAAWADSSTLKINMRPLESISERCMTFEFKGKTVTCYPRCCPPLKSMTQNLKETAPDYIPNETVAKVGGTVIGDLDVIIEMPLHGRIK